MKSCSVSCYVRPLFSPHGRWLGAISRDATGFGNVQAGTGGYYDAANYAPPGPFAMWTIVVDPDQNPGLDMSGVNLINLEFRGAGYSFGSQPVAVA